MRRRDVILAGAAGASLVAGLAWVASQKLVAEEEPAAAGYPAGLEPGHVRHQPASAVPLLPGADARRGAQSFRFCSACHAIAPGAAHGIGPNLHGVMGRSIAALPDYRYSPALAAKRSGRWDWSDMDAWLAEPARFVPGTKMTFAGIRDAERRADLLLYLNEQGGTLQMPQRPTGD